MSVWGGMIDAALAAAVVAIPGLVTNRGLVSEDSIPADAPKFAMGYGVSLGSEQLDHQQDDRAPTVALWYVSSDDGTASHQETTYTEAEAIRTALYADRTLAGSVESIFVSDMEAFEHTDSGRRSVLLTIVGKRVD